MPGASWRIVPRIQELLWGIQQTADMFPYIWIDEEKCAAGLEHLKLTGRKWSNSEQRWSHIPDKSLRVTVKPQTHLRQMAQAFAAGDLGRSKKKHRGALKRNVKRSGLIMLIVIAKYGIMQLTILAMVSGQTYQKTASIRKTNGMCKEGTQLVKMFIRKSFLHCTETNGWIVRRLHGASSRL